MTNFDKCFEENTNKSNYLYKLANESNLEINGMDGSEKFKILDVFIDRYAGKCEIDSYFINDGIYRFESYDEFKNSMYEVIARMTNLNTIYNEKVD